MRNKVSVCINLCGCTYDLCEGQHSIVVWWKKMKKSIVINMNWSSEQNAKVGKNKIKISIRLNEMRNNIKNKINNNRNNNINNEINNKI